MSGTSEPGRNLMLAQVCYAAWRKTSELAGKGDLPHWAALTDEAREHHIAEVLYWWRHGVKQPDEVRAAHGFGMLQQRLYKHIVEAYRVHTPVPAGRCPRGAALVIQTPFACAKQEGHKGPCMPIGMEHEEIEDVTPARPKLEPRTH